VSKIDEYASYISAIKVLGEISNRTKDLFLSLGEYLSSFIIASYYKTVGFNAAWANSRDVIKTDSSFTMAKVDYQETEEACIHMMKLHFEQQDTIVCGGFYGSDMNHEVTTLGRGGSDLSAAVIARCVKAERLEIFTDVSGIMSADPRLVKDARTLEDVTYNEASELAIAGAKVLHPRTIAPAVEQNIPVYVLNTFDLTSNGTKISNYSANKRILKSIAVSKPLMIIKLKFTEKENEFNDLVVLTGLMEKYGYSTKAMTLQNNSMTIAIDNIDESQELFFLGGIASDFQVIERVVAISLIGEQINLSKDLFTGFLNTLYENNIQTVFSTNSDINITFYIPEYRAAEAAILLHKYCG
jgi:aspartate kinase